MGQEIQSICVFCSASNAIDEKYLKLAETFGTLLAKENIKLVYGGSDVGMMGAVANGCLAAGGTVHGVTTEHLHKYETAHDKLTNLEVAPDMHTRKARMFELCDAIVVLPGGFGTLDETVEVLTWKQIGLHDKSILFVNFENYWTPFKVMADHIVEEKFATEKDAKLVSYAEKIEDVIPTLRSTPRSGIDPTTKWL